MAAATANYSAPALAVGDTDDVITSLEHIPSSRTGLSGDSRQS